MWFGNPNFLQQEYFRLFEELQAVVGSEQVKVPEFS